MDIIFNQIVKVDRHVGNTLESVIEQAERTVAVNEMLKDVVDSVNLTLESVDHTLAQSGRQRAEIVNLGRVSVELKDASGELIEAVQAAGGKVWEPSIQADADRFGDELRALASDPSLIGMEIEAHRNKLGDWLKRTQGIEAIWSNRADGSFIFSEPEAGLLNARNREWWKRAMAGETFVSESYISAITKRFCITLSRPICGSDGTAIGVIGIDIRVQ